VLEKGAVLDLAWISLAALLVVIVASCTTRINPGVLAIILAWIIAIYVAPKLHKPLNVKDLITAFPVDPGMLSTVQAWIIAIHVVPEVQRPLGIRDLMAGFPVDLFLTLVGVTLLFTQAQINGTLDRVTHAAVRLCRGNAGLIPVMFFFLAAGLASIGAGNIAASALIAPMAMATAQRAGISAFLMAIMVAHGAIAGALSPFAPTGVIANNLLRDRLRLEGIGWQLYGDNLVANLVVAFGGYFLFGGWKLFRRHYGGEVSADLSDAITPKPGLVRGSPVLAAGEPLDRTHLVTLGIIALLIVVVLGLGAHVGMAALAGAALLTLLGAADETKAIRNMPWGVIVMVCGVTVLTDLLEKTGGSKLLISIIGRVATPESVTGVAALLVGVISVYSSTSGVVLPAFLPLVPGLVTEVGGSPLGIASSIVVGGHLVDSSPLSTIGALCIAGGAPGEDRQVLFRQMLAWGLSMAVVGAVGCYLFF
jgi:di/tricarboxylate transporter